MARFLAVAALAVPASAIWINRRDSAISTTNALFQKDQDTLGTIYEKGIPCCQDPNTDATLPTWNFVCSTDFAGGIFRPCLVATSTPFQTRTRQIVAPNEFRITGVSVIGNTDTAGPHSGDVRISVTGAAQPDIAYTLDGANIGFAHVADPINAPILVPEGASIEIELQDTDGTLGEELEIKLLGFMGPQPV